MEENKPLTDEDLELIKRDQDSRKLRRYYESKFILVFEHEPKRDRPIILVDLLMEAIDSCKLLSSDQQKLIYLVNIFKEIFHNELNK